MLFEPPFNSHSYFRIKVWRTIEAPTGVWPLTLWQNAHGDGGFLALVNPNGVIDRDDRLDS